MPWKALIVEDDPEAAEVIASHLARFGRERGETFQVEVVGSAIDFLDERRHDDIVFLDIGLPGINGMEAAQMLRERDQLTPIIFVTDLAQYAVAGYSVDALDFMVKPVTYDDFALRMGRAMRVLARNARATVSIASPDGTRIVDVSDVIWVETLRHDLYWHVALPPDAPASAAAPGAPGTEILRVRGSLTKAAEQLGSDRFCRISASHLINMGRVVRLRPGSVVMSDGTELAFSRSRKKEASEALARYVGGSV